MTYHPPKWAIKSKPLNCYINYIIITKSEHFNLLQFQFRKLNYWGGGYCIYDAPQIKTTLKTTFKSFTVSGAELLGRRMTVIIGDKIKTIRIFDSFCFQELNYWGGGWATAVTGGLGIIGNITSLLVLSQRFKLLKHLQMGNINKGTL